MRSSQMEQTLTGRGPTPKDKLDMHFDYFGGRDTPRLFIWNGVVMSTVGGWLLDIFLFKVKAIMEKLRMRK